MQRRKQIRNIKKKQYKGEPIVNTIIEKFNPAIEFTENDMISMLYYLGYLTISGEDLGKPELTIPNKVMKEIYANYFMQIMEEEANFKIDNTTNNEILREIAKRRKNRQNGRNIKNIFKQFIKQRLNKI